MLIDWSLEKTTINDHDGTIVMVVKATPCAGTAERPLTLEDIANLEGRALKALNTWAHPTGTMLPRA